MPGGGRCSNEAAVLSSEVSFSFSLAPSLSSHTRLVAFLRRVGIARRRRSCPTLHRKRMAFPPSSLTLSSYRSVTVLE